MTRLLLLLVIPTSVLTSFCGQQAVPFSFQALKSGQPVLGCARPRCFSSTNSSSTGEPAQFYRIHGKEDGYMRKSEDGVATGRSESSACSMSFSSSSCGIGQWVGGIAPQADVRSEQKLRCCAYGPLLQSEDRGIAAVRPGQLVVGGEVLVEGRVVAFDYVADIAKTVKADGTVQYNVALRRMSCFDEPVASFIPDQAPSDLSLQHVTDRTSKPAPYSPWANTPQRAAVPVRPRQQQQPAVAARQPNALESTTEYPGQPTGLQMEPLEGNPAVGGVVTPHPSAAAAQPYTQQTAAQTLAAQQTAALAFVNPQLNPVIAAQAALLKQQQQELAKQQQELLAAQKQLIDQQKQQQQQNQVQPQQPMPQQQLQQPRQVQPVPQGLQRNMAAGPMGAMGMGGMNPLAPMGGIGGMGGLGALGAANGLAPMGGVPGQPLAMPRLPKLEELPKVNIPSIEQVEQAIPPLEKAVLTTVARFFGVL